MSATALTVHQTDPEWSALSARFPATPGRQPINNLTADFAKNSFPFPDTRKDHPTLLTGAETNTDAPPNDQDPKNLYATHSLPNGIEANP